MLNKVFKVLYRNHSNTSCRLIKDYFVIIMVTLYSNNHIQYDFCFRVPIKRYGFTWNLKYSGKHKLLPYYRYMVLTISKSNHGYDWDYNYI